MSTIGALVTDHIAVGVVENHKLVNAIHRSPAERGVSDALATMHAEEIVQRIAQEIEVAGAAHTIQAIGVGFPGLNLHGIIEESPNLKQCKGLKLSERVTSLLIQKGIAARVHVLNDAAALAAGIAATRGQLDR